jgi:hypothetical protein
MKKILSLTIIAASLTFGLVGCATTDSDSPKPASPTPAAKATVAIPADSPFAKIKPGMGMAEVYALIGQPTDTSHHITGKQFIPYYYGGDTHRTEAIYKGLGRIVFSPRHAFTSDMEVIEVNYNPDERGFQ